MHNPVLSKKIITYICLLYTLSMDKTWFNITNTESYTSLVLKTHPQSEILPEW